MYQNNAIEWHSEIASGFDLRYDIKKTFIERYKVWTNIISKFSNPDGSVLDIGCGTGVFSFYAAERNHKVIGVDASEQMIEICRRKKYELGIRDVEFIKSDLMLLPKAISQEIDIILCSSVLEYVEDIGNTLPLIVSLLKKGGVLIFSLPNRLSWYRTLEKVLYRTISWPKYYRYVKNLSTIREAEKALAHNNLTVIDSSYYSGTPFLSMALRRFGLSKYTDNLFVVAARRK